VRNRLRMSFWPAMALMWALLGCSKSLPPLALTLHPGTTDQYHVTIDMYDDMRRQGSFQTKWESHQILDLELRVLPTEEDGRHRVAFAVSRAQLAVEAPGEYTERFDTKNDAGEPTTTELAYLALLDKELTLLVDQEGRVVEMGGMEAVRADLRRRVPDKQLHAVEQALAAMYGAGFWGNLFESYWAPLASAKGKSLDTWPSPGAFYQPAFGEIVYTQENVLGDGATNPATVEFSGAIRASEQAKDGRGRVPVNPVPFRLLSGTVKGRMLLDRRKGRLESLSRTIVLLIAAGEKRRSPQRRMTVKTHLERL